MISFFGISYPSAHTNLIQMMLTLKVCNYNIRKFINIMLYIYIYINGIFNNL